MCLETIGQLGIPMGQTATAMVHRFMDSLFGGISNEKYTAATDAFVDSYELAIN